MSRRLGSKRHDAYKARAKHKSPARCEDCGCGYERGRWRWGKVAEDAHPTTCPACQRIRDRYPAGFLRLTRVPRAEREEVLAHLRTLAEVERVEHPLERIMAVTEEDGATLITTTGVHLARRLASALKRHDKGTLTMRYEQGEDVVRVEWVHEAP